MTVDDNITSQHAEVSDSEIKQRALEILHSQAAELLQEKKVAPPVAPPKSEQEPLMKRPNETTFTIGNQELVYDRQSFLGRPTTLPMSIMWSTTMSAGLNNAASYRFGVGGVATAWGISSAAFDGNELLHSHTTLNQIKYGGALTADIGMTAGGIMMLGKYGPKWLAPTLVGAGVLGRVLVDLVPNDIRSK